LKKKNLRFRVHDNYRSTYLSRIKITLRKLESIEIYFLSLIFFD
jgi:hypothetical protein